MKPDVPVTLQKLAMGLMTEIAPAVGADYLQRSAFVTAMVLGMAAEEWERAAARRVEENAALRRLFRSALQIVEDEALAARLEGAAAEDEPGLRISELDRTNDALRALLIELHAHVEGRGDDPAALFEAAIWDELRRSTERRTLSTAPF